MADYTIVSEQFPSPHKVVDVSEPSYVINQTNGDVEDGYIDILLKYTDANGVEQTVPFTASADDPMDYGRQLYADIMGSRINQLGTIKTPVWDGPPPPPEPTPEQQEIADLKERIASLERLLK